MDDEICRGRTQPQELWYRIKRESGYTGEDIDFIPFWVEYFRANSGVHRFMKDISKHYAIGLMQNVYPGAYDRAVLRGKVPNIPLAFNLQSCEVGLVKPEEEIYAIAEQKAGMKGKDILFIDDNTINLAPANERGWHTFKFDADHPDHSVTSLRTGFVI